MRQPRLIALVLAAFIFTAGCLSTTASPAPQDQATAHKVEKLDFANEQRLEEHWRKHGLNPGEFKPTLTKAQYLQKAREFFSSTAKEILHKERENGDMLRYRPSTNEFGVLSSRKVIRTYFRPDSGRRYWERQ